MSKGARGGRVGGGVWGISKSKGGNCKLESVKVRMLEGGVGVDRPPSDFLRPFQFR